MKNIIQNHIKTCFLKLIILIPFCLNLNSQTSFTIPSPNVASLGKFIEMPVSYFTGIPNISIPLHEIREGDFSMPLSLSYHATAFNPNEVPGWLGQGWALNAGGMITEVVNGLPDTQFIYNTLSGVLYNEHYQSYMHPQLSNLTPSGSGRIGPPPGYGDARYNPGSSADMFYFSFGEYSGKFLFGNDGIPYVVGCPGIKIEVYSDLFVEKYSCKMIDPNDKKYYDYNYLIFSVKGFRMTTPDGFQFEFGCRWDGNGHNDMIAVERSEDLTDSSTHPKRFTNSWYLVRVVSPENKEIVTLNYEHNSWTMYGYNPTGPKQQLVLQRSINYVRFFNERDLNISLSGQIIYPCYLTQIKTSTSTLTFTSIYSTQLYPNYRDINYNIGSTVSSESFTIIKNKLMPYLISNGWTLLNIGFKQLDEIRITDDFDFHNQVFNFYYTQNERERLRLLKISENEEKSYFFDYNGLTNRYILNSPTDMTQNQIVEYGNLETDNRGYYNASFPECIYTINNGGTPVTNEDPWGRKYFIDYIDTSSKTENDWINIEDAMRQDNRVSGNIHHCISKIIYPTGGYATFDYEPHKYVKSFSRTLSGNPILESTDSGNEEITSGIRIKSIQFFDGVSDSAIISKSYEYEMGILNNKITNFYEPLLNCILSNTHMIFEFNYPYWPEYNGDQAVVYCNSTILPVCLSQSGSFIGYSKVTEIEKNNGKKVFYYRNFKDHPDLYTTTELLQKKDEHLYDDNLLYTENGCIPPIMRFPLTSFETERGIIIGSKSYHENTTLLNEQRYNYEMEYDSYVECTLFQRFQINNPHFYDYYPARPYINIVGFEYDYRLYYTSPLLINKKLTEYHGETEIIYETDYQYEYDRYANYIYVVNETISTSNQNKILKQYSNVSSVTNHNLNTNPYYKLYQKGMISKTVEEQTYKIMPDNSKKLIDAELIKYYEFGNSVLKPSEIYKLGVDQPSSNLIEAHLNLNGELIHHPNYYKLYQVDNYDNQGNLLQITNNSDICESYYWGYNSTKPIIKAINISNDSLSTVVTMALQQNNKNSIDELLLAIGDLTTSIQRDLWKSFVDAVINHDFCQAVQISFYSYSNNRGLTSQTDPRGVTAYYEYDDFNRLKCIKDNQGNVLQKFDYHYKE